MNIEELNTIINTLLLLISGRKKRLNGDRIHEDGTEYTIGKTHFISRLQVLAESKRIHLPQIPEAETLAQEMLDFDIDVDESSGKATFGAVRPGTHDDMVCALGLACLKDLPGPR